MRELESLGPRWTGGGGQSECGYFTWFESNEMPKPENLKALARIRQRLSQIQREMESSGHGEGLERISHLATTIDWVVRYDRAALKLYPEGQVPKLIAEAETLKRKGDAQAAVQKAQKAWTALQSCGLREALVTFPPKMTTQGEFGALATINVKTYAAYLALEEQVRTLWPAAPTRGLDENQRAGMPLHVVVKTPPSIVPQGRTISVWAAVVGPTTIAGVKLGYRTPGEKEFHFVAMNVVFRKTYEGTIPAAAINPAGIEFFVEARDSAGGRACAPNGFPCLTYSASVVPWPDPAVFLTQCRALPRVGKDYRVQANVLDRPPTAKVQLVWRIAGTGEYKRVPMENVFCDSFEAVVPAAQVTPAGLEYYVEAAVPTVGRWTAPAAGAAGPRKELPDTTPPGAVAGVKAEVAGPYEIAVSWPQATDNDTIAGYEVYRGSARDFPLGKDTLVTTTFKTDCFDCRVHAGQTYWYAVRARDASGNISATAEYVSVEVPKYPPPTAPENVRTVASRGKIKLAWKAMPLPVVGYNIYRTRPGGKPELLNVRGPAPQATYIDVGLKDTVPHCYTIRAVDRGGQEGESSRPVTVSALPRIEGPVFALHFEHSPDAESGLKGKLVGKAAYAPGVVGQALDLRGGGWVAFSHDDVFDLSGELTLEAWVKFDNLDAMPVFLSHGQWRERGFFVQAISHTIRYSLGGLNDCDGGRLETGTWYYVVCTYDLKEMRVYLNGREVHRCDAPEVDVTPWVGPFYVGRYTLEGKPYEVPGLIDEVKIYQRARTGEEIRKEYEAVSAKLSAGK